MSDVIGRQVAAPEELYAAESAASIAEVERTLGVALS
jgi:hypothetical protein